MAKDKLNLQNNRTKITVGIYTIEQRPEGFRVVETETGIASGTFKSLALAHADIRTMQQQRALVKTYGKDGAIAILRGESTLTQSAQ